MVKKKKSSNNNIIAYLIMVTAFFYTMVIEYSGLRKLALYNNKKTAVLALIGLASLVLIICVLKNAPDYMGWCMFIIIYCVLLASQFLFLRMQPAYIPIAVPAVIMALLYHTYSGISFHIMFCISFYYMSGSDKPEVFIFYLLFGVIVCFATEFMENVKNLFYSFVIIAVCYAALIAIWMQYHKGKVDYFGILPGMIQVIGTFFVCFICVIIRNFIQIRSKTSKNSYMKFCDEDFPPIASMRDDSLRVFYHTLEVADLSAAAALATGADDMLARTGAMYHDIGKTIAKEYVQAGVLIAKEYKLPREVIDIIEEHNAKKRKPQSIEAAIVLVADTLVSTKDYMLKKNNRRMDQKKIIDQVMMLRMESGMLDEAGITLEQYRQMKEAFVSVLCGTIEER